MGIWHLVLGGSGGNAGLLNWNAVVPRLQRLMCLCVSIFIFLPAYTWILWKPWIYPKPSLWGSSFFFCQLRTSSDSASPVKSSPLNAACCSANLGPMSYNLLAIHSWVRNNCKSFGTLHKIQDSSSTRREYQVWKDGCCPANHILRHSGCWACRTSVICVEAAHSFQGGQNPFPSMLNLASTNPFLWKDQTHHFQWRVIRGFFAWISEQL